MAEDRTSSTHPPHPPTAEEDRLDWLRLLRSRRVGPITFWRLLNSYGTARAALEALPAIAGEAGVEGYAPCPIGVAVQELQAGRRAGARLVAKGEAGYPSALCELGDAPPLLWVKGNADVVNRPLLAMVGSRNASSLGMRMARALAEDLAQAGFSIVSGLARGIDTAAHGAALPTGTVAVLPGGIDVAYPAENDALMAAIGEEGLLVSEHPPGLQPLARHFAARNRIISGMARGVVVIEAAVKSGSLITAKNALDQGREVMAVPGHPFDSRAGGCNLLLREGAVLVRSATDVVEALGTLLPLREAPQRYLESGPSLAAQPRPAPTPPTGNAVAAKLAAALSPSPAETRNPLRKIAELHKMILARLDPHPMREDDLIAAVRSSAKFVSPALTELELDGQIQRTPQGLIQRRQNAMKEGGPHI